MSQALDNQASLTNKTIEVKTINPGHEIYPVAYVNIEVSFHYHDCHYRPL